MLSVAFPVTVGAAKAAGWSDLQAECLRLSCARRHTTQIPWTMIAGGEARSLASVVRALVCRHCGQAPTGAYLCRLVADNEKGPPTSRRLSIAHLAER